jgi:predicted P-loop ATPase
MIQVSFYETVRHKSGVEVPLIQLIEAIRYGKWKEKVEKYRTEPEQELKLSLPAFTVSGTFPESRRANAIDTHSGFIAMDFDNIDNVASLAEALKNDPYTYCLFKSVSGEGLCAIVKIEPKKHLDAFIGLEKYYLSNYSVGIDPSCKDTSRCRFVSYDPDLYLNYESTMFTEYAEKPRGKRPTIKPTFATGDDVEFVIRQIEAKKIDLTAEYHTWVDLAFSIYSQYGEAGEEYFQRISQFHPDYDERKTSIKYHSARNGSGIGISTFFYHAKKAGLDIVTPETKTIQRAATFARKDGRKVDQVVAQLEEVDNIPAKKSKPVVEAIFQSQETIETDDDEEVVAQIEEYLKRSRQIKYNEVSLKYQEKGKPMLDRDMNSVYLDVKKAIPKASKDLVFSVIDSDRTPTVNPIREFFAKNTSRNPKNAIKELASSIDSPTGLKEDNFCPTFVEDFLRKWMIGSVAMWHGKMSPLMLVLAGSVQNTGKTHFFRYLLPDELQPYFGEAELTGDKDENLLMCSKALILNDEMSNKSRKDITVMKKLCSVQWFNVRRPYGKTNEDVRRIASLCGTSNDMQLLSDPTGNRRIIPIEVNSINHEKYNSVDKTDLWMEAYHGFKGGEAWQLNADDIKILNDNTNEFEEPSPEAELLMAYFRKPMPGELSEELTNSEIKSIIETRSQQRLSARKLGMELKSFTHPQQIKRENNQTKRVYRVVQI